MRHKTLRQGTGRAGAPIAAGPGPGGAAIRADATQRHGGYVHLGAASCTTADLFGLTKNDFTGQVKDIITVGEFYHLAAGGRSPLPDRGTRPACRVTGAGQRATGAAPGTKVPNDMPRALALLALVSV